MARVILLEIGLLDFLVGETKSLDQLVNDGVVFGLARAKRLSADREQP
jgi:hypothetical protein